ncbi:hypothetical protein BVRB_2g023490 [Beta vulgaris subsp. vulgaris]|nr:hypothetical protein BVRB_2g023490 [Beta vulgaris subsp. vulgaris]
MIKPIINERFHTKDHETYNPMSIYNTISHFHLSSASPPTTQ